MQTPFQHQIKISSALKGNFTFAAPIDLHFGNYNHSKRFGGAASRVKINAGEISSSALAVSWHSWRRVSSNTRFVYRSETRRSRYCNAWRFVAHTEPVVAAYVPPPRRCDLCANNESERVSASGRGRGGAGGEGGRVCLSLRLAVCECLGDCNSNRSHFNLCP